MGLQGSNSRLTRIHNRALVLRIIQRRAPISRKEIAVLTGLSAAAITYITDDLIERELIIENRDILTNAGIGRKPIGLYINRQKHRVLSVYVGRSLIQAAVCDLAGGIIHKLEALREGYADFGSRLPAEVIQTLVQLLTLHGIDHSDFLGIAISAPGPINAKSGILHNSSDHSGRETQAPFDWRGVKLSEEVGAHFGLPVFTDNEANVAALGESWFGAGAGVDNFILYSVGPGIGSGVIIDGLLYRGEDDVVSEIGHVTINFDGPPCACGNVGCLETYAGFRRLVELGSPNASRTSTAEHSLIGEIEDVFARGAAGEEVATAAIAEIGRFLGIGAVTLANIFNPECIIISGNDTGKADLGLLLPIVQGAVQKGAFSVIANKVKVLVSSLGGDARIYGGVALLLQEFFAQGALD